MLPGLESYECNFHKDLEIVTPKHQNRIEQRVKHM